VNSSSNLRIDDETTDTKEKVYYVSRIDNKLPWPSNSVIASFVSKGNYKKFKILSLGDNDVKVVVIR
jgi:hypothetical protein